MITASNDFATAISQNSRHFAAKLLHIDGTEIQCDIINITGQKGACSGQTFTVGSVFSSSVEITVAGLSELLENEDIRIQIGLLLDESDSDESSDPTYEYIEFGRYTVIRVEKTSRQAVIKGVGFISSKLNAMYPDTTTAPTLAGIASTIYSTTGVSVSLTGISGTSQAINGNLTGLTCRGALEILAMLCGGFATETNTGTIAVHKYSMSGSSFAVNADRCLAEPLTSDESFDMTGIKVIVSEEREENQTAYELEDGELVETTTLVTIPEVSYSSGTPIRQTYKCQYMTQSIFSYFAETIVGYEFMPAEVEASLGDPRVEPQDYVAFTRADNTTFSTPCHLIGFTFDGGFSNTIKSIGESETDVSVEGSVSKQINDMTGQLAVTEQAATQAKSAARVATAAALEAAEKADTAKGILDDMEEAAEAAQTTLTGIYADAENAKTKSIEASAYANSALAGLSQIEDVVGVLQWMEDNCSYRLTSDRTVQSGKMYYTRSGTSPNYIYTVVTNPVDADIAKYYEMYVSGDTVQDFITSHLSVTSQGMYLQTDGVGSKLLLSTTDGVVLFGPNGDVIGRYGEDAQIGSDSGYNILITTSGNEPKLAFRFGTDTEIAYITGDMLYIPKAVVVDSMQVGDAVSTGMGWRWIINKTDANLLGNLTLTWIGE